MIEQLVNFVIRPPRAEYSIDRDLLEPEFVLKGRRYARRDFEVTNSRGHVLQCSHYLPQRIAEDASLPCVIYCHGNSGCRADANEAAIILLPSNITVFTVDFSGSGLSEGDYVSLGWNEMDDLRAVVGHLRTNKQVSRIGLWGRSMGAVTSLMYGAQDPSIAGMVLDSPFSSLSDLMMELVDVYKIRLPKFTVKMAVQYMRREIRKKAQFDIMDLDTVKVAANSFIPALFGHATDDVFIQPRHSDVIFKAYAGDKNIIKFEGDHNSPRPPFYYDSITIFFYNVLRPPDNPVAENLHGDFFYEMDSMNAHEHIDQQVLMEILGALRPSPGASSASPPRLRNSPGTESTEEALEQSRSRWQMSRTEVPADLAGEPDDLSVLLDSGGYRKENCQASASTSYTENGDNQSQPVAREDQQNCHAKEIAGSNELPSRSEQEVYRLYPPANGFAEPWALSSGGTSVSSQDADYFAHFPSNADDEERMIMEAIAASLHEAETQSADSIGDGVTEVEVRNDVHVSTESHLTSVTTTEEERKTVPDALSSGGSSNGSTPTNQPESNVSQRWRSLFGALGKSRRSNSR